MRIRQFVDFSLFSDVMTAEEIGNRIGLKPDHFWVRGSKRADPPSPIQHIWEVRCDAPGLRIDEQVDRVFSRILPHADLIRELVATSPVDAGLSMVRYFDASDGEEEVIDEVTTPSGVKLVKLGGQHQLLGWHLDPEVLAFLVSVGAEIDCDEYGE